jgi:predicted nucleic acid-binding protein
MRLVLNSTVISNFALVGRTQWLHKLWPDDMVTSEQAMAELQAGVRLGRIPEVDWAWLTIVSLTEAEQELSRELMPPLGEDDRVARREARRWGVPLSGTIGALVSLIDAGHISREEADQALQEMIAVGYHSPMRSLNEPL